jgi:hypothetical protein
MTCYNRDIWDITGDSCDITGDFDGIGWGFRLATRGGGFRLIARVS